MPSFSVLTVSKRIGWEDTALKSLAKQTLQPERWVIITENELDIVPDDDGIFVEQAPKKTRLSNLNASLNAGLKLIDTDYVIFYQDFIKLPPDCFEKLMYLTDKNTLVTTCTPNYDGSNDSRYLGVDGPRFCRAAEWETNVAIAPMEMVRRLGGFDEDYDNGWSWDNVNVAERAEMLGAKFIIDESNRPKLYPHEMSSHKIIPLNADRHAQTMRAIKLGKKPIKLPYLEVKDGRRTTTPAPLSNL